jgi:hypothetical protein
MIVKMIGQTGRASRNPAERPGSNAETEPRLHGATATAFNDKNTQISKTTKGL